MTREYRIDKNDRENKYDNHDGYKTNGCVNDSKSLEIKNREK